MKLKTIFAAVALAGFFLISSTTLASAQSDAVRSIYAWGATVPTNIAGVHTYPAPPAGFNPLTATDEELATHGFPPRPNKQTDASHYGMWAGAMTAAKIRWTGDLKPMPSSGREKMEPSQAAPVLVPQSAKPAAAGPTQFTSPLWSGVSSTNKLTKWNTKTSFDDVWGEFTVPVFQPPFGVCNIHYQYQTWAVIGIDGSAGGYPHLPLGGGILLQFENCHDYLLTAFVVWDEGGMPFSVNPGDIVYLEVYNSLGGANPGTVFIEDLTTLTYAAVGLESPPASPLIGNSVEWLVGSGLGPYLMGNTIGISFEGAEALNTSGKQFFPGSTSPSNHVYTMVDNSGNDIEIVSYGSSGNQGQHSLFFQTTGCAYTGGCP